MIRFILNEKEIATDLPPGMVLLDFIRYHQHLMGTKIGCREGDCGACTVLVGSVEGENIQYESMTSCLLPLISVSGKHVVTIEGTSLPGKLNPIQQAMADEGATQCGFCTPGFVMSLTGYCLSAVQPEIKSAIASIDGNICRCTGYKSIERAAAKVARLLEDRGSESPSHFATNRNILPRYFENIILLLKDLQRSVSNGTSTGKMIVGGGTDLYVQKHDDMTHADIDIARSRKSLSGIRIEDNKCIIGAATTITELKDSAVFNKVFPSFQRYARLVSSTPIRNMATVGGNFINASPIGDLTIFFLALDAEIELVNETTGSGRTLMLRNLYKGYKSLDKKPDEYVSKLWFELPGDDHYFHFEKVSKRTHLDIATVNCAMAMVVNNGVIRKATVSAGGVGPIPMYLQKTSSFLSGAELSAGLINEAVQIALSEISPISDARGTKEYKSLLLGQLIRAHFITLFPQINVDQLIIR